LIGIRIHGKKKQARLAVCSDMSWADCGSITRRIDASGDFYRIAPMATGAPSRCPVMRALVTRGFHR